MMLNDWLRSKVYASRTFHNYDACGIFSVIVVNIHSSFRKSMSCGMSSIWLPCCVRWHVSETVSKLYGHGKVSEIATACKFHQTPGRKQQQQISVSLGVWRQPRKLLKYIFHHWKMINETVNVNQHFLTNMRFLRRTCWISSIFYHYRITKEIINPEFALTNIKAAFLTSNISST